MNKVRLIKPELVNIALHPELSEKWVQEIIARDPSILGLGELILKDIERIQPKAGRLDLLLQDEDSERRYEVEIQLGRTDESHIIRTIEYWDNERKRYPQYDHVAVIIAEDVTSRFSNVIGLFNGAIPVVAIQMNAYRNGNEYWLTFTTVLNEIRREDEVEETKEITDRSYWEKRGTPSTVKIVDEMFAFISELSSGYELKYNKFYIGLAKDGQPDNFVVFRPRKHTVHIELKMEQTKEITNKIENSSLELIRYNPIWGRYYVRATKDSVDKDKELLQELIKLSQGNSRSEG